MFDLWAFKQIRMKFLFGALALLFALCAYWQLNDPDPGLWVAMYGATALHFGLAAAGRTVRPLLLVTLLLTAGWALTLVPDFVGWLGDGMPNIATEMKTDQPHIELVREFLGLSVCAALQGWLWWRSRPTIGA